MSFEMFVTRADYGILRNFIYGKAKRSCNVEYNFTYKNKKPFILVSGFNFYKLLMGLYRIRLVLPTWSAFFE